MGTVAVLVFLAVAAVAYCTLALVFSDESKAARLLQQVPEYEAGQAREAEPLLRPLSQRAVVPLTNTMGGMARSFGFSSYRDKLELKTVRAGRPWNLDGDGLLTVKVFSLVVGSLFAAAGLYVEIGPLRLAAWTFPLLGWFLPNMLVALRRSSRVNEVRRTLPDLMEMLDISVRAGLGFDQALAKVVAGTRGALAEEFGRMLQEVQAGVSRREALSNLSNRVDVADLNAFAVAIIQAEVFGVSISNVLRTQAADMRLKRRQFAEEKAQKAPVYMVVPLVLFILPASVLVVLAPAFISAARVFAGG